jgi:LysM repeat protein
MQVFNSIKKQLGVAVILAFVLGIIIVGATRLNAGKANVTPTPNKTATAVRAMTTTPGRGGLSTTGVVTTTPALGRATDVAIVPPGGLPAPSPTPISVGPQPVLTPQATPATTTSQPSTAQPAPAQPAPAPAPTAIPAGGATYTVQRGDTLSAIAKKFGTTTTAIAQLNGITNPSRIYTGQKLRIPGGGTVTPSGSAASGRVHVVQRGEYLSAIARKYGVTVDAIVKANNLRNPNVIYTGQRLIIP